MARFLPPFSRHLAFDRPAQKNKTSLREGLSIFHSNRGVKRHGCRGSPWHLTCRN